MLSDKTQLALAAHIESNMNEIELGTPIKDYWDEVEMFKLIAILYKLSDIPNKFREQLDVYQKVRDSDRDDTIELTDDEIEVYNEIVDDEDELDFSEILESLE